MRLSSLKLLKFWFILCFFCAGTFFVPVSAHGADPAKKTRTWRDLLKAGTTKNAAEKKVSDDRSSEETSPEGMVDLIDVPTTNVLDYGGYRLNFRFYSNGGVLTHLSFGVFRRLNIGVSWDNDRVIGSEDSTTNAPTLALKLRAFDGGEILPAFALGYDGQGRFFDKVADEYKEQERGVFFVFGRELFLPGLELHVGSNISRFKEGKFFGFVGASYNIEKRLAVFTEYDNIRVGPENRWNIGVRLFPVEWLSVDFAVRKVASNQDKERIVRINYVGSF